MRERIVSGAAKFDVARFAEEEARVAFMRGRATLMRNWQHAHVLLDDADSDVGGEFVAAPLPAFAGGKRSGVHTGGDLVVAEEARSPEAAMALVDFLTSEEELHRLAVDFYLPPALKGLYESEVLNLSIPPWPRVSRVILTTVQRSSPAA
jgi:trehalose/maltose transport system substrate-binding protein